jgi:hypothetical protein
MKMANNHLEHKLVLPKDGKQYKDLVFVTGSLTVLGRKTEKILKRAGIRIRKGLQSASLLFYCAHQDWPASRTLRTACMAWSSCPPAPDAQQWSV